MYCKHCGNPIEKNTAVCVKCGFANGTGENFCPGCGQQTTPGAAICLHCGIKLNDRRKSRILAGVLGILLGCYGIHNFYLGYTGKAVAQILVCLLGACLIVGPLIAFIWGVVEGIFILTGRINTDANGMYLKD